MFLLRILSWWLIKLLIRLQFREIKQLSTEDLATWLTGDRLPKPLLLDARTQAEYEVSHLMNAKLAPSNLEDLTAFRGHPQAPPFKGGERMTKITEINLATPIVVYCSVGYRSAAIARRLQSQGYENVFNLSGSIFQWVNESRLVYRAEKPVNRVHSYQRFWQYLLIDTANSTQSTDYLPPSRN